MYLIEKQVTKNGNSGHITLPADKVGTNVYILDKETLLMLRGLRLTK